MKTLTISCDDRMLQMARDRAQLEHATLEFKLREWLEEYTKDAETPEEAAARRKRQAERGIATLRRLRAKHPADHSTDHLGGKKYTRRDFYDF